jgi:formate C-acetyltransferase
MNRRLQEMRDRVREREHARYRQAWIPDIAAECDAEGLSWMRRSARLTRRMCEAQHPVIEPDQRIVFTRTTPQVPPVCGPEDWRRLTTGRTLHELGPISNICADWGMVLSEGLLGRRSAAMESRERAGRRRDPEAVEFLDAAVETIDAVLDLARRYALAARDLGRDDVADILEWTPGHRPRSFHEALQSLRLLHAVVWLSGHYHVGLGRIDQYLWPYLEADLAAGRLDEASAEELLAEFFISLNRDSDLYPGVQQGDNGQSLMLGGVKRDGSDAVNPLTWMALRVARDVAMIDPKINLRISKHTDLKLLSLATELTRLGLGFPQYSNDDVVIPALVAHGYELEDARDYAVAACWEFLIPGKGMEVLNIGAVSLPAAADRGIREGLAAGEGMAGILKRTAADIRAQVEARVEAYRRLLLPPAPYYSALMDGCLESGRDLSKGLKYNNFGIHGACSANAADALAAVEQFVLTDQSVSAGRLLAALDTNVLRVAGGRPGGHARAGGGCDRRRPAGRRVFQRQSRARPWGGRPRPDQRASELQPAGLPANLQRRAGHAGAVRHGVSRPGLDREGGPAGSRRGGAGLPAAPAEHRQRRDAPRRQGPPRAAPGPDRPRVGLERVFLRTGATLPGTDHRPARLCSRVIAMRMARLGNYRQFSSDQPKH